MDEALFRTLIQKNESDTLDFKTQQYLFVRASDEEKSELLKDILAFSNSWKETDAYILVGVKEKDRRADGLLGITNHLSDNDLQEFVNTKTNRPVMFSVEATRFEGIELDVIRINPSQARPLFLKKNFGRLAKGAVYIRRGSSTATASADEIAEMGTTTASAFAAFLSKLSGLSRRLLNEKPRAWEYFFFPSVLENELEKSAELKRDLKYALKKGATTKFSTPNVQEDFVSTNNWILHKLANIEAIVHSTSNLMNVAIQEALGAPGVAGDPEHIAYVAQRLALNHKRLLEWTIDFNDIDARPDLRGC